MTKNNLLTNLNPEQLEAVQTIEQPLKLIAGAGSGKTRVITTKIAHLIQDYGYAPWRILAVTFTNKAANEMKERVNKLVTDLDGTPWIKTFHALGLRIIRENYDSIGLPQNFNILDRGDQKTIIKRIVKKMFPESSATSRDLEKKAIHHISNWKNHFISPKVAKEESQSPEFDQLAKIYADYERELFTNKALDLDDLLLKAVQILQTDNDALERWQKKFNYILVDEFQDTNSIQFDLLKLILGGSPRITVVGDVDQTIYSWRGADIEIINNFQNKFADVKTIVLDRNYRSTQEILDLANDFIAINPHKEVKMLKAYSGRGVKPRLQPVNSALEEAQFIAKEIKKLKQKYNYENRDFFILYRSNYWSRTIENTLDIEKLPFDLVGGLKFRERRVIKDAMAFLKVILTNDNLSMTRVLQVTPKIGDVTINKLQLLANEKDRTIFDLLIAEEDSVLKVSKYLKTLRETLIVANQFDKQKPLAELMNHLLKKSGYWERISSIDTEEDNNIGNLGELIQQLNNFDKAFDSENYGTDNRLLAFLQEEALSSEEDKETSPNKITLLTVHSAKGLENKVVFVAGLNHDVFPSARSMMLIKNLEEERRLLYVAITRAKERLYLSYVNGEYSYLRGVNMRPSIFVRELNNRYYDVKKDAFIKNETATIYDSPLRSRIKPLDYKINYKRNDLVHHSILGDGVVTKVLGDEVFVAFNNPKFKVQAISINSPVLRKK